MYQFVFCFHWIYQDQTELLPGAWKSYLEFLKALIMLRLDSLGSDLEAEVNFGFRKWDKILIIEANLWLIGGIAEKEKKLFFLSFFFF